MILPTYFLTLNNRSNRSQMFYKKNVLRNFAIFTGKQLCWSYILITLQAFRPVTLSKINSNTVAFLWILRNFKEPFFIKHLWSLLLEYVVHKFILTSSFLLSYSNYCNRGNIYCVTSLETFAHRQYQNKRRQEKPVPVH